MFLGLDLGTSSLKAMLIDGAGAIIGTTSADVTVSRPHDGWSEQDPSHWIEACDAAVGQLAAAHAREFASLTGIGLSGHMHGATLIDTSDNVLRPCMLWNDTRSSAEAAELDGNPIFREIAGNIVFPGFTAPKVEWVRRHEPQIFDKTAKVLLPKDYLRLYLTGEHISEMSDAAGTAWLDVANRDWSDALLKACNLTRDHMPRLVEGSASSGQLRAELVARWGITGAVTVAGGAGDNAASAAGVGVIGSGDAFVSLGTSGVLFAANDGFRPKPESAVHTFCHAFPDTWHQMGVILSATDALNWFAGIAGSDAQSLTSELGALSGPSGVTFLPYLSGERTPHNDAKIRGSFIGLGHGTDRSEMTHAVLDGVAFALADNLDALRSTGTEVDRILAVGGGSNSRYWLEIIATLLDIPIDVPVGGDFGAALGAARLGMIAATGTDPAEVCTAPDIAQTVEPIAALQAPYTEARERFKAAYPALSALG